VRRGGIRLLGTLVTVGDSTTSGNVDVAAVLIVIKCFVIIIVIVIFTRQQAVEVVHHHHDAEQQGSATLTLRGVKLGYLTARIMLKPAVISPPPAGTPA
jgi:preprotein translocase subunit SecY